MITNLGKNFIQFYLAGQAPAMAQSIAIGISNVAATVNDTELSFEVARVPITSSTIDPVTRKIIFKGTDNDLGALSVYEIGLCSSLPEESETKLISDFNGTNDAWVGGVDTDSTNSRVGATLFNVDIAANTTPVVISTEAYSNDMSDVLGAQDKWKIALNKSTDVSVSVTLRVYGGTGYLDIPFGTTAAVGYVFLSSTVNPATATAGFDASNVTSYAITATPTSGNTKTGVIGYDALIAQNALVSRGSDVLIARSVIPVYKTDGLTPLDVEYPFGVTL